MPRAYPRFTHDCDKCIFLGCLDEAGWGDLGCSDVYFCATSNSSGGSLITRHGNEGPEYRSVPITLVTPDYPDMEMQVAKEWAKKRGVL